MKKILFIDGLRGFLATNIVLLHFAMLFIPQLITGKVQEIASWSANLALFLYWTPFFRLDTIYGVCGFFIISAYVMSAVFWQKKEAAALTAAACKRYIRLTAPVVFAVLFSWLLWDDLSIQNLMGKVTMVPGVETFYQVSPGVISALREGLWGVYFDYNQSASYSPVLWTMQYELKGSFFVLSFLALFGQLKKRWLLYPVFIFLFADTYYLAFVLGVLLSDLYFSSEYRGFFSAMGRQKIYPLSLLVAGIFLATYIGDQRAEVYILLWKAYTWCYAGNSSVFYHIWGTAFIFLAILQLPGLQSFFSWRGFCFIGKYSYAVYLVHLTVFSTFGGKVFIYFGENGYTYSSCALLTFLCCLTLIAVTAFLMERYAEQPSKKLAAYCQQKLLG